MDYNKIVQGILDIGEAMLQSGAENFRLEDSFYRMCRSYGFKRSDVFVIPSNIQVTVRHRKVRSLHRSGISSHQNRILISWIT